MFQMLFSTPVAYVTNLDSFTDPFSIRIASGSIFHRYGYMTEDWRIYFWDAQLSLINQQKAGKWRIDGFGPSEGRAGGWPNSASYDPTNGTVSNGAIYRSQKDPEGIQL